MRTWRLGGAGRGVKVCVKFKVAGRGGTGMGMCLGKVAGGWKN